WSVGWEFNTDASKERPFVDHFDGKKWARVPLPKEFTSSAFGRVVGVDGTSGDDVWVTGTVGDAYADHTPLVAHWDGKAFTVTKLPVPAGLAKGWYPRDLAVAGENVYVTGSGPTDADPGPVEIGRASCRERG